MNNSWGPIGTAPTDGRVVLVFDKKPAVDITPVPYGMDARTAWAIEPSGVHTAWAIEPSGWCAGPDADTGSYDTEPSHWCPSWKEGDPYPPPPDES